jgi:hypothetical protein
LDFGELLIFKKIKYAGGNFLKSGFSAPEFERLRAQYEEYLRLVKETSGPFRR